jgi:nitrosocyanin
MMARPRFLEIMLVGVIAAGLSLGALAPAAAEMHELTLVNIKYEGSNIWVPTPIVVKKGDTVKIKAINNVKDDPAEHGLAIPAFGIKLVVNRGKPETVEFKADKAGVFKLECHLHPAHVPSQLVVLE